MDVDNSCWELFTVAMMMGQDDSWLDCRGGLLDTFRIGDENLHCIVFLCKLSESLIFIQDAAAIPFASLTAWRALRSTANIQKGYIFFSCPGRA